MLCPRWARLPRHYLIYFVRQWLVSLTEKGLERRTLETMQEWLSLCRCGTVVGVFLWCRIGEEVVRRLVCLGDPELRTEG